MDPWEMIDKLRSTLSDAMEICDEIKRSLEYLEESHSDGEWSDREIDALWDAIESAEDACRSLSGVEI